MVGMISESSLAGRESRRIYLWFSVKLGKKKIKSQLNKWPQLILFLFYQPFIGGKFAQGHNYRRQRQIFPVCLFTFVKWLSKHIFTLDLVKFTFCLVMDVK